MNKNEFLHTAKELINGDRANDYGPADENFKRIAIGWNVIASEALATHGEITVAHVALMMDWLKTARLLHKIDHPDGWVDKVAYGALGGELANPNLAMPD